MSYIKFIFIAMILAALFFSGCKKTTTSPTGPTPPTQASGTYTGVLAGSTTSGMMTLNIPSSSSSFAKTERAQAAEVVVTGTVVLTTDSLSVTVTGTYNTSNDSLYVSGSLGSETFSFAGTYNSTTGALSGTWSDSNGDSGKFAAASGSGSAVKVYLGAAVDSTHVGTTAQLDLAVSGNTILGVASLDSARQFFTGTVSGLAITLNYTYNGLSVQIGTGSFTDTTKIAAVGTYNLESLDKGSWAVALLR
jgi:hypothetical protein